MKDKKKVPKEVYTIQNKRSRTKWCGERCKEGKSVSRAQSQALELQVRIIVGHFGGGNRLIGTVLYVRASFVVI